MKLIFSLIIFCVGKILAQPAWHSENDGFDLWENSRPKTPEKMKNFIDCDFNTKKEFCEWKPDSAKLWKTGNAIYVDSVNSISKSADGDDNFAYANGGSGALSTGSLESPEITPTNSKKELKFSYWKAASTPILDVCVKEIGSSHLDCLDSISGPGQQQWIRRTVKIPIMAVSYKIVFRSRSIHSAEDIIGLDDIQFLDALPTTHFLAKQNMKKMPTFKPSSSILFPSTKSNDDSAENFHGLNIPRNEFKLAEQKMTENIPSGSAGFLMPLKINKFGMSPSANSAIKPLKVENPFLFPNFTAPSFPDFPSLPQGMMPGVPLPEKAKTIEKVDMCKAVKCSFLESTCLWTMGSSWKRSDGNIAMEIAGEDVVVSALFKSPLGSYLEFDLWMSDDSFFTVYEIMDGIDIMLFTRQGMSNNGWHRFRIPLRPSFSPVQIKFKNSLPPGGFITLSNTRLVNGNGEEVSCETVEESFPGFAVPGILAPKPMNLSPNPSIFAPLPLMAPRPSIPLKENPLEMSNNHETSSFGGSIFEGLKPIEPMKEDPFRLTAFQGYNPKMLISTTTPEPFSKLSFNSAFDSKPHQLPSSVSSIHQPQNMFSNLNQNVNQNQGDLLSKFATNPAVEQQLRQLANRFGFDTNKMPDSGTMDVIKRIFGNKLFGNLPMNFASGVETNPPQQLSTLPEGIKPIKPVNIDSQEFERIYKTETMKKIIPTFVSSQKLNGELLKNIANFLPPPKNIDDRDTVLAKQNLDFAFINSLND